MFKFFRSLGIGKEKNWVVGDKSKGFCPHCSQLVETTWCNKEVSYVGVEPVVFVSTCDNCSSIVSCPDQDVERILLAAEELKSTQEIFGSVRGYVPEKEKSEIEIDVVLDNDLEAKNALIEAFGADIIEEVGKGDVSVVEAENSSNFQSISSLLGDQNESFQNLLRRKEKIGCKLWVNWLKFENGTTVPCNEIVSLSEDWDINGSNESVIHELEEKLVFISETEKIAILMIQKINKK